MTTNPSSDLPPIFVINRPKDTHRRADMTGRLAKVGLTPIYFDAIDGYKLDIPNLADYDGEKRRRYFGKDLKAGEIGCLLSHRAIYEKMVAENIPQALVLEDDTFLADDFKNVLQDIQKTTIHWDLIRFIGHGKVFDIGYRTLAPLSHGYSITRVPTSPSGAYAYLLTLKAATRLLHFMQRNWVPVDIIHSRAWQTRLETLLIHPSPVKPDLEGPSTIGEERFDKAKQIRGLTKLLHPFYRFWYKLSNGAGKRILYLMAWFRDRNHLSN
ncbi:glycosyltransferase family 25 protein [Sneathiella sp. HT1-7]|uniref:glycosyltransferase family 25 protein n=1 Tax=Sneathiella sp. HT1-7 TaxID=2887192 RepID=UPI001D157754|nr:glycosyltransferase family 25 protein [Sneathiella sp. HT1-7]MCC3306456.1 glycosyltransferase family 25 protein [Sneathiella sp. HT1-7]